jgi:hypothetical protein
MKIKDYAVEKIEKQLNVVRDLLINNEINQNQAAELISKIENIGLITNMDPDDIAYGIVMESRG